MSVLYPVVVLLLAFLPVACSRSAPPAPRIPGTPQLSGELAVDGLHAPVRIVRDRWGVPHITAQDQDDLFFAQGFVQAQDRLFQMDLWRRSVQGRLAEVLGSNFIERDAMTRRMTYTGELAAEWASYAPDARAIAEAFVRGVNAEVAIARRALPEPFVLAGWSPEFWTAADLLSRTEAFAMTGNAFGEVFRARLVNAVGLPTTAALLPLDPPDPQSIPRGLDLTVIGAPVADALRRIGAAPFFMGLAAPVPETGGSRANAGNTDSSISPHAGSAFTAGGGSNNWVVAGLRSGTGAPIVANDPHRALDHPSLRYLVHLTAPGWNVAGAVVPWFPGVAIGHNDRVAWGLTIFDADVQDLYVEQVNPANPNQVKDGSRFVDMTVVHDELRVKGRAKPFAFDRQYTRHGVVVAIDREKHLAFTLRWSGAEPGTAGYLAALSLDRATTAAAFREALRRWKLPGENFVYADRDGQTGYQAAALVPVRHGWNGTLPVPGWTDEYEWNGWLSIDDLPHASNPRDGWFATANNNTVSTGGVMRSAARARAPIGFEWASPGRINRIREVFRQTPQMGVAESRRLQTDVTAWNAERLVPLLGRVTADRPDVEEARRRLVAWDRALTTSSPDATMYVLWERALVQALAAEKLDPTLAREYAARVDYTVVPALTSASAAWFGPKPVDGRDRLLVRALARAVDAFEEQRRAAGGGDWGRLHTATFAHVLAITAGARARFNIGPFARPGYGDTVNATYGAGLQQTEGASYREILDLGDWDRSIATSAPGQSELPSSPHFSDLATLWGRGEYFPLVFSEAAIQENAEAMLLLKPAGDRR